MHPEPGCASDDSSRPARRERSGSAPSSTKNEWRSSAPPCGCGNAPRRLARAPPRRCARARRARGLACPRGRRSRGTGGRGRRSREPGRADLTPDGQRAVLRREPPDREHRHRARVRLDEVVQRRVHRRAESLGEPADALERARHRRGQPRERGAGAAGATGPRRSSPARTRGRRARPRRVLRHRRARGPRPRGRRPAGGQDTEGSAVAERLVHDPGDPPACVARQLSDGHGVL